MKSTVGNLRSSGWRGCQISEARERATKALERANSATDGIYCLSDNWTFVIRTYKASTNGPTEADQDFIYHSRADVPQLAKDLLEALAEIERLKDQIDDMHNTALERGERD